MPKPIVEYKRHRNKLPECIRKMFLDLYEQGLCDLAIAKKLLIHHNTVRRFREERGLESNRSAIAVKGEPAKKKDPVVDDIAANCAAVRRMCKEVLGDRVNFKFYPGLYTLDGKPALITKIIDEANAIRARTGAKHIGKKPNEIYKPRLVEVRV